MSPIRIESLTPEQEARVAEYAVRWTQISLCTDPADRPRAEAAIREMYQQGGLEPPGKIVWCGSPPAMWLGRAVDGASAGDSVWWNVACYVNGRVQYMVRDSVQASVYDRIWGAFGQDSVVGVLHSVEESVQDRVAGGRKSVRGHSVFGSHDACGLTFNRYFHDVLGLTDQTRKLSGLWELALSAGWALPHQNICWVSERHNILRFDDQGRLHSLTAPACAYPDGWAIYAVHGVRVPEYVITHPGEISVERIDDEENAEVRRVMIERYRHGEEIDGAAAYMRDAGGERVDHDERWGTLWRRNFSDEDDEPIVVVEVVNSTPEPDASRKRYWLRVPPNMTTAREAVAWTFCLSEREYDPLKET